MRKLPVTKLVTLICLLLTMNGLSQNHVMTVNLKKIAARVEPTMWGIFFEDINFAADGGLYAELVKNRSFEFSKPLMGWKIMKPDTATGVLILNESEINSSNPRFARVSIHHGEPSFGLSNEGFRGMGIKNGMTYHFSALLRLTPGSNLKMRIELADPKGNVLGSANLIPDSGTWEKYQVNFKASSTEMKARLNIWFEGEGSLDLDMISLFPDDTWKNRPGGLRADLVQLLAEMKPGFIRFPGGCIVEGRELETRYQWKKTIGNQESRKLIINRWNTEFNYHLTPDYFQSFGMGFFEYFQLCEDLGAEPLPILSCGLACQYNSAEAVPLEQLDPYIQDAMDLIEFANGSGESGWGKIRAQMGHPAPFNLKMIGIGNEQWGEQYIERYKVFAKVLKTKYPAIKLVSSAGPSPSGKNFDFASKELKNLEAEIVDEHYYSKPDWFFKNASRYDGYDRNSYKIFAGEYAAHGDKSGTAETHNNWECALSEAAFMTGLERNADVVHLCSYAPLFAHIDAWQWSPDLIWFDNLQSYGTPNYYVQKLFATNKGTDVVPILSENKPVTGEDGLYASATTDQNSHEIILKLVNSNSEDRPVKIALDGAKRLSKKASALILRNSDLKSFNSFRNPVAIVPIENSIELKGKLLDLSLPPYSFSVIKIKQD